VTEARRAAELTKAPELAAGPWARGVAALRAGEAALAQEDFATGETRLKEAEGPYRQAEQNALQQAGAIAARERERLAALRRQLDAAEQAGAAAAAARREAEQAGAPRRASRPFGEARERERRAQAALEQKDYPTADVRLVNLRYPTDGLRVQDEAGIVAALIASSRGVADIRVLLNGAEIHRQRGGATERSLAVTAPVTFREGTNAIVVSATEVGGAVRQELRTVILDRPKGAAPAGPAPLAAPRPAPNRWAVVVGVGAYEHRDVSRLQYTVPDVEAMYEVRTGLAGFKKENVVLLTDRTERKPTLRNVRWALGTFLARAARRERHRGGLLRRPRRPRGRPAGSIGARYFDRTRRCAPPRCGQGSCATSIATASSPCRSATSTSSSRSRRSPGPSAATSTP